MLRQTIRGADLAVWQSGSGERELVFVHGFQNDHTVWRPLERPTAAPLMSSDSSRRFADSSAAGLGMCS